MTEKITIQDIARIAGVSKATVSRVLNEKPDVDPVTRERILRIMEEQGFVPSITASGLAGGRNRLIGVLIPPLNWPLLPELMRGVAEIAEQTPYELVLYSISSMNHERDRRKVIDRILTTKLTAGLLAIFPGQSAQYMSELHRQGFPVVLLDDQYPPPANMPWVGADNRRGAYEATRHLLQLGHRRIAHIQGPMKWTVSHDRFQGYCDALQEFGLVPNPALVSEGDFMPASARSIADAFFSLGNFERPTAIFAASDLMAYGVMSAAEEHGLRIPDDVALVGFDDTSPSALLKPPLTTVSQPFYKMGQRSISLLLNLIEDVQVPLRRWYEQDDDRQLHFVPASSNMHIQLPTNLVVRASCGSPLPKTRSSISEQESAD